MSTKPFLNSVTMHERFMPYELGRQLQRFHDDHPGLLTMLTDKDWEWIRDVTESISDVLPRWRRYMRSKHPYKGFIAERRRARVMDKNDPRLKRNTNDRPDLEGQKIGHEKPTEMNQDVGSKVAFDVDSEQEGVDQ
ncbi:uncharacterized protein FPRO_07060 [Fusarium proliferatum ET1]|uniref:Uncharacterized protein n=1 Tax=Fusarium proliferatum (strain ET1) TaxID=1227346 RepID=A0A1L7VAG6_FUSPR|nr:uncharacterized protein FPRO_07060 [Fusarium proliferatum ET1]CZR37749.1 uncharacterized protein FPRO_07060 [Fusarium proliferatum ET1]